MVKEFPTINWNPTNTEQNDDLIYDINLINWVCTTKYLKSLVVLSLEYVFKFKLIYGDEIYYQFAMLHTAREYHSKISITKK